MPGSIIKKVRNNLIAGTKITSAFARKLLKTFPNDTKLHEALTADDSMTVGMILFGYTIRRHDLYKDIYDEYTRL